MKQRVLIFGLLVAVAFSVGCGGGGGGGSSSGGSGSIITPPTAPALAITTTSLPDAEQGIAYSTTLGATGGTGAYHWSITNSINDPHANGLAIDANTGVLSGMPDFVGQAALVATLTDSAVSPQSVTKTFSISGFQKLTSLTVSTFPLAEYSSGPYSSLSGFVQGGKPPYKYAITGGSLPPGMRVDAKGYLTGSPYAVGTFQATVAVSDSMVPAASVNLALPLTVKAPGLEIGYSGSSYLQVGRPFSGNLAARGGTSPYTFSVLHGIPDGLSLVDPSIGLISGTPLPSALGVDLVYTQVTDSSSPPKTALGGVELHVMPVLGRNDTPATASRVGNGSVYASISPYIDPPNGPLAPGDSDYYKLLSVPGAHVSVNVVSAGSTLTLLDPVIEILDGNGILLNLCNQPSDPAGLYKSACVNDDISANPHDMNSALTLLVPAGAGPTATMLVHVLDWRGDARPDMLYIMSVTGVVDPLGFFFNRPYTAAAGLPYSYSFVVRGGVPPFSWTLVGGALPAGITLSKDGVLSGTPTARGTYIFTAKVSDAVAQEVIADYTIVVN